MTAEAQERSLGGGMHAQGNPAQGNAIAYNRACKSIGTGSGNLFFTMVEMYIS